MVSFMDRLDADETVSFAEGADEQTQLDWFKGFLGQAGTVIDFAEHSGKEKGGGDPDDLSPEQLSAKAVSFQESERQAGRTVSIAQAVRHVKTEASA